MAKKRIQVNHNHISKSLRGHTGSCMVADALRDQLDLVGGSVQPFISVFPDAEDGAWYAHIGTNKVRIPAAVARKIEAWDKEGEEADRAGEQLAQSEIKPFAFDLDLPDNWRDQITPR